MSGEWVGMPGGGSLGRPGCDGSGVGGEGLVGGSLGSGCCIWGRTRFGTGGCHRIGLPNRPGLL